MQLCWTIVCYMSTWYWGFPSEEGPGIVWSTWSGILGRFYFETLSSKRLKHGWSIADGKTLRCPRALSSISFSSPRGWLLIFDGWVGGTKIFDQLVDQKDQVCRGMEIWREKNPPPYDGWIDNRIVPVWCITSSLIICHPTLSRPHVNLAICHGTSIATREWICDWRGISTCLALGKLINNSDVLISNRKQDPKRC